jgi:hypothetical protein
MPAHSRGRDISVAMLVLADLRAGDPSTTLNAGCPRDYTAPETLGAMPGFPTAGRP